MLNKLNSDDEFFGETKPAFSDQDSGRQDRVRTPKERTAGNNPAVIRYVNGSYVPDKVHVSIGDEVRWVNEEDAFWPASNLHPTHTAYPGSDIRKCYSSSRDTLFDSCEALGRRAEYSFVLSIRENGASTTT